MHDNLHRILEAILFASDNPLSQQKLKDLIEGVTVKEIRDAAGYLNQQYDANGSALKIIEIAGGYQIVTREEYAVYMQKLYKGRTSSRLTQRALETLSIVAYKQPITKQEIESIRGVNVDAVMKTLLERNLITVEGRQKAPGSPLLYGTTKYFLEYFGLKSLDALPKLKEIDELLKSDDKFLESLDQVALEKLAPETLGLKNPEELEGTTTDQHTPRGEQIPLIAFDQQNQTAPSEQIPSESSDQSPEESPTLVSEEPAGSGFPEAESLRPGEQPDDEESDRQDESVPVTEPTDDHPVDGDSPEGDAEDDSTSVPGENSPDDEIK